MVNVHNNNLLVCIVKTFSTITKNQNSSYTNGFCDKSPKVLFIQETINFHY